MNDMASIRKMRLLSWAGRGTILGLGVEAGAGSVTADDVRFAGKDQV
jgi:hypothetical protein